VAIVARELAIGLALGVTAAVPLVAGEMVGAWVAASLGDGDEPSPWSTATGAIAALVFFALGGHRAVMIAILASYRRVPVMESTAWVDAGALLLGTALALALPILGALMVAALALGAVERAGSDGGMPPAATWMRAAAVLALAAMVFALAYGVAGLTRALPAELAR
jgi:flagellar biosynthesis protein FliR